jgi:hypothetical protein
LLGVTLLETNIEFKRIAAVPPPVQDREMVKGTILEDRFNGLDPWYTGFAEYNHPPYRLSEAQHLQ